MDNMYLEVLAKLQQMITDEVIRIDKKYFKLLPSKVTEYSPDLYNSIMSAYMCYSTENGIEWSYPQMFSRAESFPPEGEFMEKFGKFQYQYLKHINSPIAERLNPEPKMPNGWK